MKTAVLTAEPVVLTRSRLVDYLALTKPRIAVLVLFTVGAGVLLGSAGSVPWAVLFHAVFGTALVAAGASALNQWLEKHSDARMRRTQTRPLPAGRMQPLYPERNLRTCGASWNCRCRPAFISNRSGAASRARAARRRR